MGIRLVWSITIIINVFTSLAGNNPAISVSSQSTSYLDLSNKSASAVLNDPSDPLATLGIDFQTADEDPSTVTFTCASNKTSVVPNNVANLIISGTGNLRNLKIKAKAPGYATITVTIKDKEGKSATYTLKYAVSAPATLPSQNHFFTHLSSASTGIAVDKDYMWIGDDEYNELSLYNRKQSGMPVVVFDPTSYLKLPEPDAPEIDIEASCMSPSKTNRCYWIGSMSNSKSGEQKPNRDRLFATDLSGTGGNAKLSFVGYASLRSQIIAWGDAHGYNLTASTKTGVLPKQIDGFSLEGMEFGPDNKTLYLGFRTPFVPANSRTKALICPVLDFEKWFNNGTPSGKVTFGAPIELNLGGRGIRSICKNTNNQYMIIAGAFDGTNDFALYHWSGQASEAPVADTDIDLHELNPEGIVEVPTPLLTGSNVDLISDNGTQDWYNDDTESKDLKTFEFQKFAVTKVALGTVITNLSTESTTTATWQAYPNPASEFIILSLKDISGAHIISLSDLSGKVVLETQCEHQGQNTIKIALENILPGFYILKIEGDAYSLKVSVE